MLTRVPLRLSAGLFIFLPHIFFAFKQKHHGPASDQGGVNVTGPHTMLARDGGSGLPSADNRSAWFWLIWQKDVQAKR